MKTKQKKPKFKVGQTVYEVMRGDYEHKVYAQKVTGVARVRLGLYGRRTDVLFFGSIDNYSEAQYVYRTKKEAQKVADQKNALDELSRLGQELQGDEFVS